ncbi:MAG TPA: MerR family transcriptional regulator [bacterium]|nr:MerR family transcriptional regulator [bacterium]
MERFSLGQVERMTGVPVTKVSYWLSEFPELRELALEEEDEVFLTYEALGLVLRLELLLDEVGLTIAGARRQLALDKAGTPDGAKLTERLRHVRDELSQVRQILEE